MLILLAVFCLLLLYASAANYDIRNKSLLFIGDSTMALQKVYVISNKLTKSIIGFGAYIDLATHDPQSTLSAANSRLKDAVDVVYLNFGALHLLHYFPEKPFNFGEYGGYVEGKYSAQYLGNINFESWIEREVLFYLSQPQVKKVILQTPNTICESRFYGVYKQILDEGLPKSYFLCHEWVMKYGRLVRYLVIYSVSCNLFGFL
jgi:hypothetical protein